MLLIPKNPLTFLHTTFEIWDCLEKGNELLQEVWEVNALPPNRKLDLFMRGLFVFTQSTDKIINSSTYNPTLQISFSGFAATSDLGRRISSKLASDCEWNKDDILD